MNMSAKRYPAIISIIILAALISVGCKGETVSDTPGASAEVQENDDIDIKYANGFSAVKNDDGSTLVTIGDEKYLLTKDEKSSIDATVIHVPVKNIYLASSSAMDLFLHTDALDNVIMTSTDEDSWTLPEVKDKVLNDDILYVGKYSAPDYEAILEEGCDLVIENTMIYHSPKTMEQLKRLGLPVIVETSSYEEHVLGRMEWIRLYGLLTGHEAEADAYFEDAEKRLNAVKSTKPTGKKVVFFYITSSGYANVRKPGDYISELIEMAGGKYFLEDADSDDSLSTMNMDMESFTNMAHDADVLIYNSTVTGEPNSVEDLISEAPFLSDFKAVRSGEIWYTGGNMFQMTGSMPDVAEELVHVIAGDDDEGLSFFKRFE